MILYSKSTIKLIYLCAFSELILLRVLQLFYATGKVYNSTSRCNIQHNNATILNLYFLAILLQCYAVIFLKETFYCYNNRV